jgi:pimeloyl-ACP methyl ester carboxylesterase
MDRIPLVLLPGVLLRDDLWTEQKRLLAGRAEPIVYNDHSSHDDMGAIARAILAKAPRRFALAGLSMGGYVAMEIMAQAPERVIKLALLDTHARADGDTVRIMRQQRIDLSRRGRFVGLSRKLFKEWVHPDRAEDETLRNRVAAMAQATGRDGFVNQYTALMNRPDRRADIAGYRLPTLVLCGREDAVTPLDLSQEMAALIPGAELAVIEHCGHLSTMEEPEAVAAALDRWLAD